MSERSRQSVRGLTLTVLIPCLLFSAALAGWITYRDLYRVILNHGFEQKLVAVSTGVAAFIDGDVHLELSRASRVTAMAGDPTQPVLWAVDVANDRMVIVDLVTGGATGLGPLPVPGIGGLAYNVPAGRLLAVVKETGRLVAFVPGFSEVLDVGAIEAGAHDLALAPDAEHLVAAGPWGLRGYARSPDGPFAEAWATSDSVLGVTIDPETGALFALQTGGRLMRADVPGQALVPVGVLDLGDEEAYPGQLDEVRSLASSPLTHTLFGSAARLVAISPEDGTFSVERFRRGYRDPGVLAYRGYVEPMRRIRAALDITYLYTQNVARGDSIQYIVDSTPGEDHSPIGAREALETDTDIRGLADVMDRGLVYSSGIEDSEEWGLLKSAYAPIVGDEGVPVGMVGTDISVSTIQDRTQIALAKVGLVTVVILFLGGLGSVAISLRLTGPLAAVQEGASRVAAGRMGKPIDPPRLRDLAALTTSFNEMTRTLTSSVDELREETHRVESMRTRRHLAQELATRITGGDRLPPGVVITGGEGAGGHGGVPALARTTMVGQPSRGLVLAWLRPVSGDPLTVLAEREEMALLAGRILEAEGGDPSRLLTHLGRLWNVKDAALVLVDASARTVTAADGPPVRGTLRRVGGAEEAATLRPHQPLVVPEDASWSVEVPADAGEVASGGWSLKVREARACPP